MQHCIRVAFCFKQFRIVVCGALMLLVAVAQAATQIVDPATGKLMGATGVDVGGSFYDLSFVDGSCVSLFSGCDSLEDFAFRDAQAGSLASRALLDQVLLDTDAGLFDTFVALTNGLDEYGSLAGILIPYGFYLGGVAVMEIGNGSMNDHIYSNEFFCCGPGSKTADTSISGSRVWSVWTSSESTVTALPEPHVYAMMLAGLGVLGWVGRRKKSKVRAAA